MDAETLAATGASNPILLMSGCTLNMSITGTWTGTVKMQRLIPTAANPYRPSAGNSNWQDVDSWTANYENRIDVADGCWYRMYFDRTSGSAVVRLTTQPA